MSQTIEMIDPVTGEIIDEQQIAEQLLAQAKPTGSSSSRQESAPPFGLRSKALLIARRPRRQGACS
ncbi:MULTISPECIES: hypothetical protein [Microbacterium]|jgi:hypothetical protein|uniref:hypothetical protein n=1 Tax=Microbacterium TaxID=33882 RepID=UPI0019B57DE8|nr:MULTISPECIES: hypothetical protein [Microbacterium]MBD3758874.1 hypothetical protein [Microbacterium sp.]MBZ6371866.1 hypothetical protein [Microbacterium hominis]